MSSIFGTRRFYLVICDAFEGGRRSGKKIAPKPHMVHENMDRSLL